MKVKYLTGPKCGQTSHVPNSQEFQVLVAAGIIEVIPKPVRGSAEWLNAMAEEEEQRVSQLPADRREPEPTAPTWSLRFVERSNKYVVVQNSLAGEVIYGENVLMRRGVPDVLASEKQLVDALKKAGCPHTIIAKYLDAKTAPDFVAKEAARIEADKRAADAQRERERQMPRFI